MKGTSRTIKRRRRESKTDYVSRLELLKSRKVRLVIRKTNRYIIAQLVESNVAQDKVVAGVSSRDLLAQGWPEAQEGSLKNLAAAYLTGALLAKKAKVHEAIVDMGMYRNVKSSKLYAVIKGAVDHGLKIPHDAESMPSEKRLEGGKTKETFIKLKEAMKKHG